VTDPADVPPGIQPVTAAGYPHLMSPLALGSLTLSNRVVMGSMHLGLEDKSRDLDALTAFYLARARGGVGLITTGGFSPNRAGVLYPGAGRVTEGLADDHRAMTDAVRSAGAAMLLQLLHAGRYSYHPLSVSASSSKSPITPFRALTLSDRGVVSTIDSFSKAAELAARAGYAGVEVMGSEGYLINQFLAPRTNHRTDRWGGSAADRRRFATRIVQAIRAATGPDFLISFRLSLADLVSEGQTWQEVTDLAHELVDAGVTLLGTGIGWHESRVPTIATSVPRAAFAELTARLRQEVSVPVVAANRINTPEVAERLLAEGSADLVQLARPLLADPDFVGKSRAGNADAINTCIACNQACLDRTFTREPASCMVNPMAGRETELVIEPATRSLRVAVVGAGPAGLAAACTAAECGHRVELFESSNHIGGQFDLARRIPGKEEFAETLRYFTHRISTSGVRLHLNSTATVELLREFDVVLLASGVRPRIPDIIGVDHPSVLCYPEVLTGAIVGQRVAIIGAGGIGVDVAEFLTHSAGHQDDLANWQRRWGVTDPADTRGGVMTPEPPDPARTVYLLQRRPGRIGATLGTTTGWIHRASLRASGVQQISSVTYERIDDEGLHITVAPSGSPLTRRLPRMPRILRQTRILAKQAAALLPTTGKAEPRILPVDTVVLCAGQESVTDMQAELMALGVRVHLVGGADVAHELDAVRAIEQGTRVAAGLGR